MASGGGFMKGLELGIIIHVGIHLILPIVMSAVGKSGVFRSNMVYDYEDDMYSDDIGDYY